MIHPGKGQSGQWPYDERKATMSKKLLYTLGGLAAVITIAMFQRDFIYGTRGNMGQGTHPRF